MRRSGSGMPTRCSHSIALARGRRAAQRGVALDHLDDLRADRHHRVQAGRRLLEDHADAAAAHVAHPRLRQLQDVVAFEVDAAAATRPFRAAGASAPARSSLAAARFADQREGLAAGDRERQRVDRAHQAAVGVELGREALDREHAVASSRSPRRPRAQDRRTRGRQASARRDRKARARGSNASRTASANSGSDSTSATMKANAAAKRPPHDRVARHLVARDVDHAAEAVHRRIDADADVGQHRLVEDQPGEIEHREISTRCVTLGRMWRAMMSAFETPKARAACT